MIYGDKLGAYCQAHHPDKIGVRGEIQICDDGEGPFIAKWPEELGKPPTPEEVSAWTPTPPDPDKAPAPSLEIRDYKTLDVALEAASTVSQVKAVFRAYLRKRAGL